MTPRERIQMAIDSLKEFGWSVGDFRADWENCTGARCINGALLTDEECCRFGYDTSGPIEYYFDDEGPLVPTLRVLGFDDGQDAVRFNHQHSGDDVIKRLEKALAEEAR